MADIDLSSYKNLYLETARKQVQTMLDSLQQLESGKKEQSTLEQLFIAAHSLKGQSLTMSYNQTAEVAKLIEHYFRTAHSENRFDTPEVYQDFISAVQQLFQSIDSIEGEDKEIDLTAALEAVKKYQAE